MVAFYNKTHQLPPHFYSTFINNHSKLNNFTKSSWLTDSTNLSSTNQSTAQMLHDPKTAVKSAKYWIVADEMSDLIDKI